MIILTSYGFRSPVVAQKLKPLIEKPEEKTVTVVPFAGFDSKSTGEREKQALIQFGFMQQNVFVLSEEGGEKSIFDGADYIYVPGGNPFKLLAALQKHGYCRRIVEALCGGASYIGVSAGAYIASENIAYVKMAEDDNGETADYTGLGLIEKTVLCHAEAQYASTIAACRSVFPDKEMILIDNDEVYVTD